MKKLMLSVFFAFVLVLYPQDPYRLNDSTFVYPCVHNDSITSYNFIALPLSGYTTASDIDPAGNNIDMVCRWNSELYGWEAACFNPYFGWVNDFAAETGQAYLINAMNSFDLQITGDSVYVPPYSLGLNMSSFMVPLWRQDIDSTEDIKSERYSYCADIYRYLQNEQKWHGFVLGFSFYHYPVWSAMPLLWKGNAVTTWPDEIKSDHSDPGEYASEKASSNGPKIIYFHVIDKYGNDFDLLTDRVTFKAWINNRPHEILNQDDCGCGFIDLGGFSVGFVNVGTFQTNWSEGEELTVLAKDEREPDFSSWTTGEATYVLDGNASPFFKGFEAVIPGSGAPVQTISPDAIDPELLPSAITLHQNYPNPFNPETSITYSLPKEEHVRLSVFNLNGQLVKELVNGKVSAGYHSVNFTAFDLNSGVYYYIFETGSTKLTKKMLFVK